MFDLFRSELDGIEELDRYPEGFSVTIGVSLSDKKSSEIPPIWNEISQMKLNPRLLFNTDEEMEACQCMILKFDLKQLFLVTSAILTLCLSYLLFVFHPIFINTDVCFTHASSFTISKDFSKHF